MSLIDDVADYLEDNGIGVVASSLFVSYLPESPDTCYAIFDTGGFAPDGEIVGMSNPTFQITVRDVSFGSGRNKLEAVKDCLHALRNTQVGDTYFWYILALQEGGHIGRDENGRDEFSINFRAKIR
jgi:hypothetical protein